MVRAHGAGGIGYACRLQRTRVPGRQRLTLGYRDAVVVTVRTYGQRAVTDQRTDLRTVADVIAQQGLCPFRIAPFHTAGIHIHGDGRARLDGVHPQLIAEPVQVGYVLPVVDRATGTQQGKRLELQRGRHVVAGGVVDDVGTAHDTAAHAVVHPAAAFGERLVDAGAIELVHLRVAALGPVLVGKGVQHVGHGHAGAGAALEDIVAAVAQVGLAEGLVIGVECLAVRRLPEARLARFYQYPFQALGTHYRADPAARGMARRMPPLALVGGGDGGGLEHHLPRRADTDGAGIFCASGEEFFATGIVPQSLVVVRFDQFRSLFRYRQSPAPFPVGRPAGDDNAPVTQLH